VEYFIWTGITFIELNEVIKMEYDFDYMKDLYISDPEEFNRVAQAQIDEVINKTSEEHQKLLRAQQWRIRQELVKIKDPVARMNKMVTIFWPQVIKFVEVLKNPHVESKKEGQVIDFNSKGKGNK